MQEELVFDFKQYCKFWNIEDDEYLASLNQETEIPWWYDAQGQSKVNTDYALCDNWMVLKSNYKHLDLTTLYKVAARAKASFHRRYDVFIFNTEPYERDLLKKPAGKKYWSFVFQNKHYAIDDYLTYTDAKDCLKARLCKEGYIRGVVYVMSHLYCHPNPRQCYTITVNGEQTNEMVD